MQPAKAPISEVYALSGCTPVSVLGDISEQRLLVVLQAGFETTTVI